jgi:hypothetical protein
MSPFTLKRLPSLANLHPTVGNIDCKWLSLGRFNPLAMKNLFFSLLAILLLSFCTPKAEETEKTLPQLVATAYGFENMDEIAKISYTWNVRRDSVTVMVRDWAWNLDSGKVYYSGPDTTLTYTIADKTADLDAIDQRFINDRYWLLFPFQLAWDTGYTYEVIEDQKSPIQGVPTTKLIIKYNDSDGYTPGDAYDLYVDDNHMIKEWVFRRGDGPDGRAITWDAVQEFEGIKIHLEHMNDAGEKVIWFTNVAVEKK